MTVIWICIALMTLSLVLFIVWFGGSDPLCDKHKHEISIRQSKTLETPDEGRNE
jgi:hypothetical protein